METGQKTSARRWPANELTASETIAPLTINRTFRPDNFDIGNTGESKKFQQEHSCGMEVGLLP
jgi:hypothetical protein